MASFATLIRPYVDAEIKTAEAAERQGKAALAFTHLERAHVLGQSSTVPHVRVHWRMLMWGLRHRRMAECVGQVLRIIGASALTAIGLVPSGNTGGSNISPFKVLPIATDLAAIIRQVRADEQRGRPESDT